jgi:PAS domain S-box-containing protein
MDEDRNLATITLPPGQSREPGQSGRAPSFDLLAVLDLDASPIKVRERITLRGLHSSGGIGEVWMAYDEVLQRDIALKRLKLDKAEVPGNRARFLREARITGQLDHPGVVPVYDYSSNEEGTRAFYTMRFVRGRTLREVIHEFHRQRVAGGTPLLTRGFLQLLGYFASVANTVAFAHSRKVIHRDLKGENVIIGDFGEVVLLDWGLAKQLVPNQPEDDDQGSATDDDSSSQTLQGEQLGTPSYMAPEQATGQIDLIDERTDVYGLAALLYEILTGRPPFRGNVVEVLGQVIGMPPKPPRKLVPEVPAELEVICLQGLAKSQGDRQQSVVELAKQVQDWLDLLTERRRTEQERERFFDLSLDLLVILDHENRFSQSNAAWQTLLGWSNEARVSASLLDFVVAEDRPIAATALAQLATNVTDTTFEARMRGADGSTRWVDWNVRSIPGERANYLVGRDVSERKLIEQEFRALVDSAPDALIVVDAQGRIQLANRRVEPLFGHAPGDLIGRPIEVLLPERLREAHVHHMRVYVENPTFRMMGEGRDLFALHRDGSEFPVDISLSPVEGRAGLLVCCALRPRRSEVVPG